MILKRLINPVLGICFVLLMTTAAVPQEEKKAKQVKDQQEYDLINSAIGEADPVKKIQVLDQWKEKYLQSDYAEDRMRMYMVSYQQSNQPAKAVEMATELLKVVPSDFSANYSIALLTPFLGLTTPHVLSEGDKAAKALLDGAIEKQFVAANKQPQVSQADWDNAKRQAVTSSYQTLGWSAMQRQDNVAAEEQFKKLLELNPSAGQVSYWLGDVVLKQGNPNKNELALFSLARAAVYEGPGALPPDSRQQVDDYLTKVYTKYTGTEEGLMEIKQIAKTQALPSVDLKIESADVRAFKKEQVARKNNPLLYRFIDLKANLTGANGARVWGSLNGKLTPAMQLYVVSAVPPERPQALRLSSKRGGPVEVVLNLANRLRTGVRSGRAIRFEGVATNISRTPFRLTLGDGKLL